MSWVAFAPILGVVLGSGTKKKHKRGEVPGILNHFIRLLRLSHSTSRLLLKVSTLAPILKPAQSPFQGMNMTFKRKHTMHE